MQNKQIYDILNRVTLYVPLIKVGYVSTMMKTVECKVKKEYGRTVK